jgi:predicted porin
MKKSLIALAVAGVVSAPAFAATSNVDVYGIINVAMEKTDDGDSMGIADNASRIGFKGSEDLGGGLKAIWQIESGLTGSTDGHTGVGGGSLASRNTFVGLSGGFGTFLMGRHDTPYKMSTGAMDIFADTIADYEDDSLGLGAGINNTHDGRSPQAVAYVSPSFNGLTIAAAIVSDDAANDDEIDAVSLSANYANGPLSVAFGYQNAEEDGVANLGGPAIKSDIWKIGVGYSFGDLRVNAIYENGTHKDAVAGVNDIDLTNWVLNAQYTMGPMALKVAYYDSEADIQNGATIDSDMWALGLDYNLSKRTTAYFVYADGDVDGGFDNDGWNIGLKHSF